MPTKLEELAAMTQAAQEKQTALETLARQQVQQPTFASEGPQGGGRLAHLGRILGIGASPEQRQRTVRMLTEARRPGETRTNAWARGMLKADDIAMQRAQAQRKQELDAAKLGVTGAQQGLKNEAALYELQQQETAQKAAAAAAAEQQAYERGKVSYKEIGGRVYKLDAQGRPIQDMGPAGDGQFTLGEGQQRYNPDGSLLAENTKKDGNKPELSKTEEKRYKDLLDGAAGRREAIRKTLAYRDAFASGAESGLSRKALKLVPGTWTDQARFDDEFDASREFAAREALKASGDSRYTDVDVVGAKAATSGSDKDEAVNVNLLNSQLRQLVDAENELRKYQGLEPIEIPETQDHGDEWYQKLFGNEATGLAAGTSASEASKVNASSNKRITW